MKRNPAILRALKGIAQPQKLLTLLDNRINFLCSAEESNNELLKQTIHARHLLDELIEDYMTIVSGFTIVEALEVMSVQEISRHQAKHTTPSIENIALMLEYRAYQDPDNRNRFMTEQIVDKIVKDFKQVKDAILIQ